MNGYKFFAVMPNARKSKSASIKHPMSWTRATMHYHAKHGAYVECLAVTTDGAGHENLECAGALMADNDQAVCGSSTSRDYLRKRCVRISESLARKLHPALFRYLDQPIGGA